MMSEDNVANRFDRQKFLGGNAQEQITAFTVGVVGLGGGGSHLIQQLAHVGFQHYVLYDFDTVSFTNLNRLVGATVEDAEKKEKKVKVAERLIKGLQPNAIIRSHQSRWQDEPEDLKTCQLIFGALDTYLGRKELEECSRRYLMTLVDIGMDVHTGQDGIPIIGGQAIISAPGGLCMRCMGFLTDEKLAQEQALYGGIGSRPQVVWSNGVLASTAISMAMNLISGWTGAAEQSLYLIYDGNRMTVKPNRAVYSIQEPCSHFPPEAVGPVIL
ncbi:MAG: molybdopterin-synthase adenylyltransferase [Cyanobacteriota bacterium erpe_2018_sw_21hr_WHONDRS-SW48-000092_B_bin.40]|jgi:hypothetical protein|nr:molybdopterin-synthase adenylyltransferase [Cyanobacteriota bacterium erpe_2018_sw_21hr_WHONDRS-SW48-000092_B_bin.40]